MSYSFENKMLELSSKRSEILDNGEQLIKQKRIDIGVERYYDIDALEDPDFRRKALSVLEEYQKQLVVEKDFYSEFHRTFVEEVNDLAFSLSSDERVKVLARSLPGLEENNSIRMEINLKKSYQNTKVMRVVEIYNVNNVNESDESIMLENEEEVEELNQIFQELDVLSKQLASLSRKQIRRGVEGKRFVQRFLDVLRRNS